MLVFNLRYRVVVSSGSLPHLATYLATIVGHFVVPVKLCFVINLRYIVVVSSGSLPHIANCSFHFIGYKVWRVVMLSPEDCTLPS